MILYWIFISAFLLTTLIFILGILFKNTKILSIVNNPLFTKIIKKILLSLFSLFIIATSIFLITELIPKKYFVEQSLNYNDTNIFAKLFNFYYDLFPIPKKICATTYLEGNEFKCSSYKYSIINLGNSYSYMKNTPILDIIKEKCSISFIIGIIAYVLQCIIGLPLGIFLAKKENSTSNKFFNITYCFINIIPSIIYFYLFVILFMVVFDFPVLFEANNFLTYIPPLTAVTLCSSISIAYFVRKYILLELNKDYVKFAESKGFSKNYIIYKHVLRNALLPFIRTVPYSLMMCFCGYYLLEISFNVPGVGQTLIHAIQLQDTTLIRGLLLFFSFLSITAYLLGDILTLIFRRKSDYVKEGVSNERT